MSKRVDEHGFKLGSVKLDPDAWFYASHHGLTVVRHAHGTLQSIVSVVEIPWAKLKPAIDTYQKCSRKQKRKR